MTDSSFVASAIAPNLAVIRQGGDLLTIIGTERYTHRVPMVYNASIGGHLRHIIEHYQSFFRGLESGRLDYEQRARNAAIETDPAFACDVLAAIAGRLESLGAKLSNHALDYCAETNPGRLSLASLVRELEFLLSHTVHHYALVAVMCRLQDFEPEPSFGVAPSTLRYQATLLPCAR